jgi:hypothetical protein
MHDPRAIEAAKYRLRSPNLARRFDAITALVTARLPAGVEILQSQIRKEKNKTVRNKMKAQLQQLEDALGPMPERREPQKRIEPPPPIEGRDRQSHFP